MREWLGLPVAASAEAAQIDLTLILIHWLMVVLFVGWSALFVYTLVRFRQRSNPQARPTDAGRGWATGSEVGVLIAEIALLAFLSIPAWTRRVSAPPNGP